MTTTDTPQHPGPQAFLAWPQQMIRSWWGLFGMRAPWSGDVTQAIDTSLLRATGTQLGFVNITEQATGNNPDLEQRIISKEASYGRQLGQLLDAVAVLARHTDRTKLTPDEHATLDGLINMRDRIDAVKRTASG